MSGQVGNLSNKQAATLAEFREKVKDIFQERPKYDDDYYLLRWLRARNFDVKKSETMLRNNIAWRVTNGVDTILQDFEPPEVMKKYFCGSLCGQDKEGAPVFLDTFGMTDMKGILMSLRKQEVIKSRMWLLEEIYHKFEKKTKEVDNALFCCVSVSTGRNGSVAMTMGKRIDQVVVIFDLDKFGMKHLWKPGVDVFTEIVSMCESNYPETLKKAFVVNAPRIFPIAFSIIKPFLSVETQQKITICGTNYKDVLLQHIDADQLPAHWGGTLVDPDGNPRCPSMIIQGGPVPKEFFGKNSLSDLSGFTQASIGRGSSLQLDFHVLKAGNALRWQFKTDGFDIGFGVFCRTSDHRQKVKDMDTVIATQRVNSHMIPEYGMVHCQHPGTYVMRFDNTFSWMRPKKLFYSIEVLEPQALELDGASNQANAWNHHHNDDTATNGQDGDDNQDLVWTTFTSGDDDDGGEATGAKGDHSQDEATTVVEDGGGAAGVEAPDNIRKA